jgi:DNA-binding MarR family transcriptional regulator
VDTAAHRLVEALSRFGPRWVRWVQSALVDWPLGAVHLRALGLIHEVGPQRMSELRDALGVTSAYITVIADGLQEHGYIRREQDPDDRRVTRLAATEAGAQAARSMVEAHARSVASVFNVLTTEQQHELSGLLEALTAELDRRGC